jgi:coenzyme F420 hydrogenase subunit beta
VLVNLSSLITLHLKPRFTVARAELAALLGDELTTEPRGSAGKRASAVKGFIANVERAAGGLPLRRMPNWVRPIVGWLMPRIGPRGLEFARTRLEMKAAETIIHLRREEPKRVKSMVPPHVWALVERYGLRPGDGELPTNPSTPAGEDGA